MNYMNKSFYIKLAERMFWTAAEAAVAVVTVEQFDLPSYLIMPAATVLAAIKGFVARKVGTKNDPATLPAGV